MQIFKTIADFLANATVRRLLVSLIGLGTVALEKKVGLNLDPEQLYGIVAIVVGYIAQSAVKEGVVAGADAKTALAEALVNKPSNPNP